VLSEGRLTAEEPEESDANASVLSDFKGGRLAARATGAEAAGWGGEEGEEGRDRSILKVFEVCGMCL
jgi:hypothetical protein